MKNYYKVLGLTPDCSQAEIKKAYKLLALEHHPDRNGGNAGSEERFKEILEAYTILGDVAKRNAYDFAKGYQTSFRSQNAVPGQQTPATFSILFRQVKDRVIHAGGRVNREALFTILSDLLSESNIRFLVDSGDLATTGCIVDDILVCCIFLSPARNMELHGKLLRLADQNSFLLKKLGRLETATDCSEPAAEVISGNESSPLRHAFLFLTVLVLLIGILLILPLL